jgi:hypothetical protein
MKNVTQTITFKRQIDYILLNKPSSTTTTKLTNEFDDINSDLYKYLLISIMFLICLIFSLISFWILKIIYRNCCKNYKIKSRLLMGECGCFLCLFHKYTAEKLISKSRARHHHNLMNEDFSICTDNEIRMLENGDSCCTHNDKNRSKFLSLKKFYTDYSTRKKLFLKNHGNNQIYKITNKNNSNSEDYDEIENGSAITFSNDDNLSYKLNDSLIYSLVKENFKDYNDIDLAFITNEILLTDSHLNSETSI